MTEPIDPYEPDHDRYLREVIELLKEIRDRLPEPKPSAGDFRASMFGYVQGSGKYPTEAQIACAKGFLDGSMFRSEGREAFYPTVAWDICREIVRVAEEGWKL